jgi:thiosulfate dehydrogenase
MARQGEAIFLHTYNHPVSAKYVGNKQSCENCHLDAGRLANSSPMWASWVAYPAYRKKSKMVNTRIERIQGCFKYSMNAQGSKVGYPPSAEGDTIVSLVSYFYWLATAAPTGDQRMPGRGYPRLSETPKGFDPERGEKALVQSDYLIRY